LAEGQILAVIERENREGAVASGELCTHVATQQRCT
jgi:hypothetical protein